ncbi:hypothetical protein [Pseudomonas sp. microsymbiont 2]
MLVESGPNRFTLCFVNQVVQFVKSVDVVPLHIPAGPFRQLYAELEAIHMAALVLRQGFSIALKLLGDWLAAFKNHCPGSHRARWKVVNGFLHACAALHAGGGMVAICGGMGYYG